MMYLTRVAGIETSVFIDIDIRYCLMYLTRVAGILLRLPLKAVRNANVRAGHAPPLQRLENGCRISYPRCGN